MRPFVPLATWSDRFRALAVLGAIAAITTAHLLSPQPAPFAVPCPETTAHAWHSVLEGLYYVPILLAGYWGGRLGGGAAGALVTVVYAIHVERDLGGLAHPENRSRLLALILFPAIGLVTGLLADRLRRETRALVEAERQLRRAEMLAALGELSAVLAHEIRNPLAAIRGAGDVLSSGVAKGSRDEEFAGILRAEVQRLDRVLTEFLQFARPGKPGEDLADPTLCAKAVFTLLRPQAEKNGVDLRLHGGGIDRLVRCPPEALRQVLLNLCLNALQAMGAKGGAVTVRMTEPEPGRVRLVVDDTGPGLPAADRERIFRPFYTTKEGGTGLGLSVVAKVVAQCGGTVEVGEAEGGGARFSVTLPSAPAGTRAPVPEVIG
jgi:signal transduction histidine kinase